MSLLNKFRAPHLIRGQASEQLAHDFLVDKGFKLICRNFRCKQGELDLIMTDNKTLVIVEVRYRKNDKYGSAVESITAKKQSRIIAASHVYLDKHPTKGPIRFDIIGISGNNEINWIKNAF